MASNFYDVVKARRSIYNLSKKSSVSDARIEEILKEALTQAPTALNSQTSHIVLLLGSSHDELWDATKGILNAIVPAEAFPQTEAKINGFKGGYGTVLFFEDMAAVKALQEKYALYKDNFPVWSDNGTGILQYLVWASFAGEGLGASLQHYHPLINDWVAKKTGAPSTWKLTAQMPFGVATAPAGPKEDAHLETRFKVIR